MTAEQFGRGIRPFSLIPNEILDTAPDYHIIMVWCAIWRHANGSEEGCWASVQRLSKVARIGRDRTRSAIKWLKENGWLVANERPGFTTTYRCTLEGGGSKYNKIEPLNSAQRQPLLDTSTPTDSQEGYPYWGPGGEQYPLKQDPNSLLSSGISDEIPTDAAANEFCSGFSQDSLLPAVDPETPIRKPRAKGSEEFERFWKLYLSAPVRAGSQSKPKALAQWQKTIRHHSEAKLIEALETEIAYQAAAAGSFVCPLPDCFRWLRDERFNSVTDRPITTAGTIPDVIR
jgi:hypothetical protein